jgi:hypothetical protein
MSQMEFSPADWCFVKKSGLGAEKYYSELRRIGYEAVEMTWSGHRAAARAAGLEINLCGPGMKKGLNRREHHAELLPQIRQSIAEAATDRIPYVVLFSGNCISINHYAAGYNVLKADGSVRWVVLQSSNDINTPSQPYGSSVVTHSPYDMTWVNFIQE